MKYNESSLKILESKVQNNASCLTIFESVFFQRLKKITQSEVYYISNYFDIGKLKLNATRYTHSLSVYDYSTQLIKRLKKIPLSHLNKITLLHMENSFYLASLAHDIGHAPFSHTTEYMFGEKSFLKRFLIEQISKIIEIPNNQINHDINKDGYWKKIKEHEYVSSIALLYIYNQKKDRFDKIDIDFSIRCICGIKYEIREGIRDFKKIRTKNFLIEMLNSKYLDIDKIEYLSSFAENSKKCFCRYKIEKLVTCIGTTYSRHEKGKNRLIASYSFHAAKILCSLYNMKDFEKKKLIYSPIVFERQIKELKTINKFMTDIKIENFLTNPESFCEMPILLEETYNAVFNSFQQYNEFYKNNDYNYTKVNNFFDKMREQTMKFGDFFDLKNDNYLVFVEKGFDIEDYYRNAPRIKRRMFNINPKILFKYQLVNLLSASIFTENDLRDLINDTQN